MAGGILKQTYNNSSPNSYKRNLCTALFLAICFLVALSIVKVVNNRTPVFKLHSVSVSVSLKDTRLITADWNVAISIQNTNVNSKLHLKDFTVWVRCMTESSSQAEVPSMGISNGRTRFVNATVVTTLSDHTRSQLMHGLVIDVVIKSTLTKRPNTIKAVCKDVGLAPGGVMKVTKDCRVLGDEDEDEDDYEDDDIDFSLDD